MKHFFLTFFLITLFNGFSQTINENLKTSIETENIDALTKELQNLNYSLDECFQLKEKPYSLFSIAIKLEKYKLFDYLIERKANINKICEDKSPLMYAVKYGNIIFVKKLVEAGVDIFLVNGEGRTAIDYAKKYEQKEILEYLQSIKK
ncbi:ankyrin repeat domain-containing protein [Flavobacterium sp.]|uniref:ankyrin repeat domain-containing protein n=1 Tax=Flavobacterium sp. TaxID=239 RepID=UPI003F6961E8